MISVSLVRTSSNFRLRKSFRKHDVNAMLNSLRQAQNNSYWHRRFTNGPDADVAFDRITQYYSQVANLENTMSSLPLF